MEKSIYDPGGRLLSTFHSFSGNEETLFQVTGLFPIPIKIFRPDGVAAFANRTWLEMHNIARPEDIIGTYNVRENLVVNERLGLNPYIDRMFEGETILTPERKAPLEDLAAWCHAGNHPLQIESVYMEIMGFPIFTPGGNASHFVGVFMPTRVYRGNPDIARALEYLDDHWTEEYDTGKLAAAANLSPSHFSRLFKKQMGATPYSYYQNLKIQKLKEALCDQSLTISEAFRECGVDYSGNFAKVFKELVGVTPSAYRSQMK